MCRDIQNVAKLVYILCFEVIIINSKTSTLWKLNSDKTKIVEANAFHHVISYTTSHSEDDPLFEIITSTEHCGSTWVKRPVDYYCTSCQKDKYVTFIFGVML